MPLLFISALIVAGGSILFLLQYSARYRRELVTCGTNAPTPPPLLATPSGVMN